MVNSAASLLGPHKLRSVQGNSVLCTMVAAAAICCLLN